MIPGYREGSDLTIVDAYYQRMMKDSNGKYKDDTMTILYRDNPLKEKKRAVIEKPTYVFYETEDDVVVDHNLFFIEKDKVKAVEVPYRDLLKKIAEDTGNEQFFYDNIKYGTRSNNQLLHTIPEIFNSDMNIEDHYRFRFDNTYKNDTFQISKAFLDIETDTDEKYMAGDFPELGECPINAVSLIDVKNSVIHIFALENDDYTQLEDFKKGLQDGSIFVELKEFIRNHMGIDKRKYVERFFKYEVDKFNYEFHFYKFEDEIVLIRDVFRYIHTSRPDFCASWNAPFDIPYFIERVISLGYNPKDILCSPDIPDSEKYVDYWIDVRNVQSPEQRGDTFNIAGYTVFVDQLVQFASRRKNQVTFDNMKLDNIASIIAGVRKLDMYKYAKTYGDFPRKNYKMFLFYNIMDTIAQHCIEYVVGDLDFMFNKCLINNTRYNKCHRQTVYLTNRGIKCFYNDGYIMGNNCNKNTPKPPKFPGALVGDPLNNSDYPKISLGNIKINMCRNLNDFDYKSLYPSILREFNIAPNTQIGKVEIANPVHGKENPFEYDKYSRGGQFLEDFQCGSVIEFCSRWFHLAGYMEMLDDMKEYFAKKQPAGYIEPYFNGAISLVYKVSGDRLQLVEPVMDRRVPLVTYVMERKDMSSIKEKISSTAQMDIYDYEKIQRRKQNMLEEEEMANYDE